ncbi:DUF2637 domain-containing protein [Nocardiopsis sediminis]
MMNYLFDEARGRVFTGLADALDAAPWYAWPTAVMAAVMTALGCAGLAVVVLRHLWRGIGTAAEAARAAVTAAAHGDQAARRRVRAVLNGMSLTTALSVSLTVASGFGALGIARVLETSAQIPAPFSWFGFAVFQALAIILMAIINERAEKGLPARGITAGFWALVATEAVLNTTHSDNLVGRLVFAAMTVIAALGYQLRMSHKRRGREEELRRAEGRWADRRLAAIRWLRPVERVQVMFELAGDENLGAEVATARVRERAERRRAERAIGRVCTAVWRLRRDTIQARGWWARWVFRWAFERRAAVSEARAQAAIDAAGLAVSPARVARVLARLQWMDKAGGLARMPRYDLVSARGAMADLITEDRLARCASRSVEVPERERGLPWTEDDPTWEELLADGRSDRPESGSRDDAEWGAAERDRVESAFLPFAPVSALDDASAPPHDPETARTLVDEEPVGGNAPIPSAPDERPARESGADAESVPGVVSAPDAVGAHEGGNAEARAAPADGERSGTGGVSERGEEGNAQEGGHLDVGAVERFLADQALAGSDQGVSDEGAVSGEQVSALVETADAGARSIPPDERRAVAERLWLADHSWSGAALARKVGAGQSTGSRWRREFEREHGVAPTAPAVPAPADKRTAEQEPEQAPAPFEIPATDGVGVWRVKLRTSGTYEGDLHGPR